MDFQSCVGGPRNSLVGDMFDHPFASLHTFKKVLFCLRILYNNVLNF